MPTTPTTFTGQSSEPATLKYTAEPPSASAVSPNGVKMESSAILPTTSRLIGSHPVGGGDAEQGEGVGKNDPGRSREQQAGALGLRPFGCADGAGVMVPAVHDRRQLVQEDGDPVRLALTRGTCHGLRET